MKNNLLSIDEYRNNPEFYFCKGLRCADKNNLNDAFKNLYKAVELEPDNCEYKFNIACFLSEMQRPKEANKIFNDILLNYDPTMFECYFGLGCNSFELGETEKAAEYFEKYLHFDKDGEFCEEVAEMIFYLKLYGDNSQGTQFHKWSNASLRYAQKYIQEEKLNNATRELCKSVSLYPFNVDARNLLTLSLLEQQNYERAQYIGMTVRIIDKYNVWAHCLCLYVLSHSGKHSRVRKFLDTMTLGEIDSREDLLCAAATLIIFDRVDELILLLEMYIAQYSDKLIFAALLLGYAINYDIEKFNEIFSILEASGKDNAELMAWMEYVKSCTGLNSSVGGLNAADEYCKVFKICEEAANPMYDPERYKELYVQIQKPKQKLSKRYMPIIECAVRHREIMYIKYYRKEIICLLSDCLKNADEPVDITSNSVEAYSAALEYNYCKLYYIECEKEDLIKKYNISLITFNRALQALKLNFHNKFIL
ncbi:tetratricopeptide repeat protein [Ruminiclostridium sufflavum DSM 19573]|uniref:Tetratricopeptide repeat protein n=1 Tax=Ruminiclostridium sufflavum DSM 19573 TaxID=1121337 RepID=A0A318XMT3_9FIRM|nr:tetratricopeptide repeat protein [Ruminiclostridium sufflavum]PYG88129.1 tetratricopeptide repeat protein [Ruminiclostridium sufflavum DSM 19573]